MTVPNFLYVGAPRAGSTWVFEALRAHPQVFVPIAKYVKYYLDEQHHRGEDWYLKHFADATANHIAIGEITTGYLYSESALRRIAQHRPDIKIVATLRNPIERDWSAYLHMKRNARVTGSFREELDGDFRFITEYSKYQDYLPLLFELFPRENILIQFYDDLSKDPTGFAQRLYGFLGVDANFEYQKASQKRYQAREARNSGMAKLVKFGAMVVRKIGAPNLIGRVKKLPGLQGLLYKKTAAKSQDILSQADKDYLIDRHSAGIKELSALLNTDLSHWLAASK